MANMKNSDQRAVVVITIHKNTFDPFELCSLRQCRKIFFRRPIKIFCPEGLDLSEHKDITSGAEVIEISSSWLSSVNSYNRFHLKPYIYRRLSHYDFVLFYEPDSFVFSDQLDYWVDQNWDYIGAPWFEGFSEPTSCYPVSAGNGGFSLRKIQAEQRVLHTFKTIRPLSSLLKEFKEKNLREKIKKAPYLIGSSFGLRNNFFHFFNDFSENEDKFWALYVPTRLKWFRVAPWKEAMRFSFEVNPRKLFAINNSRLPFGCHKWMKYDFPFWKEHLEKKGYTF